MRQHIGRVTVWAASLGALSIALTGCGSMPSLSEAFGPGGGFLSSGPSMTALQLDSSPPGAQATTSLGAGCRTPCTVEIPAAPDSSFTVSFTLDRHVPQTIPVQIVTDGPAEWDEDGNVKRVMGFPQPRPNPVFAALEPARPTRGKAAPPKRQQAAAPPRAAAAPQSSGGFPPPPSGGFPSR